MVKCEKCGKIVSDGKFCENCGADISNLSPYVETTTNSGFTFCPHCGTKNDANNKFCENCGKDMTDFSSDNSFVNEASNAFGGFFGNVKKSVNKATMDLLAIKSDFSNNKVLYKVEKIPVGEEKKIKVEDGEVVFVNTGNGYSKYEDTFTLNDQNINCIYAKKVNRINYNFKNEIETNLQKVELEDTIKIVANYECLLEIKNLDLFFDKIAKINEKSMTSLDVCNLCQTKINKEIVDFLTGKIKNDGGYNLKEDKNHIDKYTNEICVIANKILDDYGITLNNFILKNVDKNIECINAILIKNLYKGE